MRVQVGICATMVAIACTCVTYAQESGKKKQERIVKTDREVLIVEVDGKTGEYRVRPVDSKGGRVIHWIGDLAFQEKDGGESDGNASKRHRIRLVQEDDEKNLKHNKIVRLEKLHQHSSGKTDKNKNEIVVVNGSSKVWVQDDNEKNSKHNKIVRVEKLHQHSSGNTEKNKNEIVVVNGANVWVQDDKNQSDDQIPPEVRKLLKEHGIDIKGLDNVDIDIEKMDGGGKKIKVKASKNAGNRVEKRVLNFVIDSDAQEDKFSDQESPSDRKKRSSDKRVVEIQKKYEIAKEKIASAREKIQDAQEKIILRMEDFDGKHEHVADTLKKLKAHFKDFNVEVEGIEIGDIKKGEFHFHDGDIAKGGKGDVKKIVDGAKLAFDFKFDSNDQDTPKFKFKKKVGNKNDSTDRYEVIEFSSDDLVTSDDLVKQNVVVKKSPSRIVKLDSNSGGSVTQQMNRLERRVQSLEKKLDLILKKLDK